MIGASLMSIHTLVRALQNREEAAWQQFVEDYGRLILFAARKAGLDESDREEVFQNTCLAVYQSIQTLRDPKSLSSWVYVIAHRFALEQAERGRGRVAFGEFDPLVETIHDPAAEEVSAAVEKIDEVSRLGRVFTRLESRCRRLLDALYLEEPRPSYEMISARESMPIGSIGPTRARCLKKLEELFTAESDSLERTRKKLKSARAG